MQDRTMRILLMCGAILLVTTTRADPIPAGRYAVDVHLDLPHIDTRAYDFVTEVCLRPPDEAQVLGPLSPGPLGSCPRVGFTQDGELVVRVRCPGGNAGMAIGRYRTTPSGFRGRVEMNLGGKNMTLAEEQRGKYLGACR